MPARDEATGRRWRPAGSERGRRGPDQRVREWGALTSWPPWTILVQCQWERAEPVVGPSQRPCGGGDVSDAADSVVARVDCGDSPKQPSTGGQAVVLDENHLAKLQLASIPAPFVSDLQF